MTAAELLRGLDGAATAGPWRMEPNPDAHFYFERSSNGRKCVSMAVMAGNATGRVEDADGTTSDYVYVNPVFFKPTRYIEFESVDEPDCRLITTTRNLLPLMAALVEAVGIVASPVGITPEHPGLVSVLREDHDRMTMALAALNAAAAKEV